MGDRIDELQKINKTSDSGKKTMSQKKKSKKRKYKNKRKDRGDDGVYDVDKDIADQESSELSESFDGELVAVTKSIKKSKIVSRKTKLFDDASDSSSASRKKKKKKHKQSQDVSPVRALQHPQGTQSDLIPKRSPFTFSPSQISTKRNRTQSNMNESIPPSKRRKLGGSATTSP